MPEVVVADCGGATVCHNGIASVCAVWRLSVELRFHSPYRRWIRGLLTEVLTFLTVIIVAGLLALAAALVT